MSDSLFSFSSSLYIFTLLYTAKRNLLVLCFLPENLPRQILSLLTVVNMLVISSWMVLNLPAVPNGSPFL